MVEISRRAFVGAAFAQSIALPAAQPSARIGLGFGTYGMQSLKTEDALRTLAEIGYDGVQLALMPGWPSEPKLLSKSDRTGIRKMLGDLRLALPALLESLPLTTGRRAENLERLKQAADIGHDLAPSKPPVLDTILGLKSSEWDKVKSGMVDELKDWARVAEKNRLAVCFKPHAGHAVDTPERALWLIREVGSKNLRVVYDYSHFYVEGLPLAATLKELLPVSPFISVKDSAGTAAKHDYLLPGDGKTDYVEYFKLLKDLGYTGFVSVEVSAQIHRKPGYEPISTAKLCYERLAQAFVRSGVERPVRKG